ncbi:hypothetical protein BP6252_05990 [Coleophoma cylindrospora]|uniref:Major facilitator superfamily (MFS) profile domain-containing protein n=1 Tax=Coleophoma cylindrospora TaxID=1849047 RepID=A0A3D8RLK9_9HELO|nr:hypothetical protein BP6252_05990 [Coleophoma cylindrospora]
MAEEYKAATTTTVVDISRLQNNTNPKWWKDPGLKKLVLCIAAPLSLQITVGYDESLVGSLLSMKPFLRDMGNPNSVDTGMITGMFYVGAILISWPAAYISDNYGRKMTLYLACFFQILGPILMASSQHYGQFYAGRMFLGAGVTLSHCAGPPLINEIAHPRMRETIALWYNTLWSIGSIVAGWLCFGTSHMTSTMGWRIPCIVQCVFAASVLSALPFIPESPRWLIAKERYEEAKAVFVKYHANGDNDDELVKFEMEEITATIRLERKADSFGWGVMWENAANRSRFYIVLLIGPMLIWTGQSAISYYFSEILNGIGITTTSSQTGINGGLTIWNFVASITGVFLCHRFGRRTLWLTAFAGMLLINVIMIILSERYAKTGDISFGYGFVVMMFALNFFYQIGPQPLCYSYSVEILPYVMRSRGLVTVDFGASAALLVNSFTNAIALQSIGWYYYFVFMGCLCCSLTYIYFFFPETKGLLLEEVAVLFEGQNAAIVTAGVNVETFQKREIMETGKGDDKGHDNVVEKTSDDA